MPLARCSIRGGREGGGLFRVSCSTGEDRAGGGGREGGGGEGGGGLGEEEVESPQRGKCRQSQQRVNCSSDGRGGSMLAHTK